MCGIAGFVDFQGHSPDSAAARIKRMSDTLVHRGPDAEGFFVDDRVALGHRRLSIIDLGTGQQPMAAAGGAVQIVFNGEIYNFTELRRELEGLGHAFRTRSDTEVILEAYLAWGGNCLERLNGMFAFGLWDARSRQLLLARDRVGKKPLYFYRDGSRIAFASELKALRAGGSCPEALDPEALDCYFSLGYIPAPWTIYRGVRKLRAACSMMVSESGEQERRYWHLDFEDPVDRSMDAVVEELEPLLDDAVRCRLMSEVPLGAFLSGGIDSSLVVASMSRQQAGPVITNSIGFDERKFSELDAARATAIHLGTDHREHVVRPAAADVLPRIAWHMDEPMADPSAVPTWYVCEMARKSVTVALSGDGGDEAFGGYTFRYRPHALESRLRGVVPPALRSALLNPLAHAWPASARLPKPLRLKTVLGNLATSNVEAFYRDLAQLRDEARRAVYSDDFMHSLHGFTPRESVYPYYLGSNATDPVGKAQHTDVNSYLTDDVLVKVDRMSMAHSLEVRSPLLDHRILEFTARLPARLKMRRGLGKLPLRELVGRRLPRSVLEMPKRGFTMPVAEWLRQGLRPLAERLLFRDGALAAVKGEQTRKLWKEHLQGGRDHSSFLWAVIMLALWEDARAST